MNPERLKLILINPEKATKEDAPELESLINTYPYFQAAKVLLAKVTGASEDIKRAAVVTADRALLMKVINGTFDKDINLPNLDDLEIDNEVNAFEQLNEKVEEPSLTQIEEDTEQNDNFDRDIDELLKSFEDEDSENATSEVSSGEEVDKAIEETVDDNKNTISLDNTSLSDFSTDEYKLPDYNYDFNNNEKADAEITDDITEKSENNFEDLVNTDEKEENTFEHFEVKDIEEESKTITSEKIEIEDEDSLRDELMASLAELERVRRESNESVNVIASNEGNIDESQDTADKKEDTDSLFDNDTGHEDFQEEAPSVKEEIFEEKKEEIKKEVSLKDSIVSTHPIVSHNNSETINDTKPMFDDNLFELNNLIDSKKDKVIHEHVEELNGQKEVIDRFINTIPELTAQNHESREYSHLARDLYDKSVHADTSKMTETMAKMMIMQGKLPKAVEIYEHLMLKYPEKKSYFASLIEKIRKDI